MKLCQMTKLLLLLHMIKMLNLVYHQGMTIALFILTWYIHGEGSLIAPIAVTADILLVPFAIEGTANP